MHEPDNKLKETLRARGICVIIPTYNNAGTIVRVVSDCLGSCSDVIVVNDGSTDETGRLLEEFDSIVVVDYSRNRGKGYALKQGFRKARELGFSYAITIDADGQHYPKEIVSFLSANQKHPGCLIVGARNFEGVERSKGSGFANKFSNFWFYIQTGRRLEDTQTGYRLYPLKKLHGLRFLTSRYEAELELLVFSSWHGVNIVSVPINVYYPPAGERVSHFRPVADFARISVLNTVLCILAVIYGLPLRLWRFASRYLRTLMAMVFCVVVLMLLIQPAVWLYLKIGGVNDKKRWCLHRMINRFSKWLMFRVGIPGTRFSYKVDEKEDFEKPSMMICNHQSHFDLMCQLIFTPRMVFLTNDWVWNNPLYGLVIRNAEFYPVTEGIDSFLPKLRSLVSRGYHIAIYPEGTRSPDCSIQRFHKGAFHIAELLDLDVLPMYLYGTGRVLPKKKHTLNKGPIFIEVGQRFTRQQMAVMGDTRKQASVMRQHYKEKYEELCNKMDQDV